LCITAKIGAPMTLWVNHVGPTRPMSSPDVRFTSNRVQTSAPQRNDALCHNRTHAPQQISGASFDHLVGEGEQRWWNFDPERLCSLQVYDQLEFDRQLNRQVRGLRTLENEIGI
jgi:hypothetical protein